MTAARRRRIAALGAAAALASVAVAGCTSFAGEDAQGGFGLPTGPAEGVVGAPAPVTGVLRVERDGCFTLETDDGARPWVLWPAGAEHDGDRVRLPDGAAVGDGTPLEGVGARVPAEALPGWADADSYLGSFGRFCGAGERGVVVLDEVRATA